MPILYGTVPEWGIAADESGILIDSLSFDAKPEEYTQKNAQGRACGWRLTDETMDISLSGAVPLGAYTNTGSPAAGGTAFRLGSTLPLSNVIPDIWAETPTATTVIIKSSKISMSNSDAQKRDVSATAYAFGSETNNA